MIGCGNSNMSDDMYKDGYTDITNIDISSVVVKQMQEQQPYLKFLCMDATQMSFENNSFNYVLDKGTIDAILCGENSIQNVRKVCAEVSRVLKPKGVFFVITYGKPRTRLVYFKKREYQWKVDTYIIEKGASAGKPSPVRFLAHYSQPNQYFDSQDLPDYSPNSSIENDEGPDDELNGHFIYVMTSLKS
eukprot:TRINITY_DN3997_c0_g1_i1.p1 TRINITY_DN3997_c0_g1~~TRINITY_DN3997_c0_g1_i1.p1  ORF type:complete len:189 (-),score=30.98 TRINITY_DN3997_c0_g1_i1:559-1125(-)